VQSFIATGPTHTFTLMNNSPPGASAVVTLGDIRVIWPAWNAALKARYAFAQYTVSSPSGYQNAINMANAGWTFEPVRDNPPHTLLMAANTPAWGGPPPDRNLSVFAILHLPNTVVRRTMEGVVGGAIYNVTVRVMSRPGYPPASVRVTFGEGFKRDVPTSIAQYYLGQLDRDNVPAAWTSVTLLYYALLSNPTVEIRNRAPGHCG
jgi:hypothetical protein